MINEVTQPSVPRLHRSTKFKDRGKVLAHDHFRQRIHHSDMQTERPLPWLVADCGQKLMA
jgi:hypothetical protein